MLSRLHSSMPRWKAVGAGRLVTTFFPDDGSSPVLCDDRVLKDQVNVVVTYHNPLDNVFTVSSIWSFTHRLISF